MFQIHVKQKAISQALDSLLYSYLLYKGLNQTDGKKSE